MYQVYNITCTTAEDQKNIARNLALELEDSFRYAEEEDDLETAYRHLAHHYREHKGETLPDLTKVTTSYGWTYNAIEEQPEKAYAWLEQRYDRELAYLENLYKD